MVTKTLAKLGNRGSFGGGGGGVKTGGNPGENGGGGLGNRREGIGGRWGKLK